MPSEGLEHPSPHLSLSRAGSRAVVGCVSPIPSPLSETQLGGWVPKLLGAMKLPEFSSRWPPALSQPAARLGDKGRFCSV